MLYHLLILACLESALPDISDYLRSIHPQQQPEHVAFIIPRKRLLVFLGSDSVCVPCRLTRAELRKLNRWQVGSQPTGHIQIVDVETDPSSLRQYAVTSTPTFILVESGQVTYRREGFLDFRTIAGIYNKEMPGQIDRTRGKR